MEGGAYLIHFVNAPLNFWFRIPQKLEDGGDPWEHLSKQLYPCFKVCDFSVLMISTVLSVYIT